jgi:putative endonuclease
MLKRELFVYFNKTYVILRESKGIFFTSFRMTQDNHIKKDSTRKVGSKAEELACYFLAERGYKIIKRNFTVRGGELDVIAEKNGVLVFIEVKARYSHDFGLPIESITPAKIRFLRRSAQIFIHQNHLHNKLARFDVVTIDYVLGNPKIEILENAF